MADNDAADRSSRTTPPHPLPSAQPLSSLVAQRTTSACTATPSTATAAVTRDAVQHERMSPARNGRYGGRLADLRRPHEENFGSSCDVGEGGGDDDDDDAVAPRRTLAPRQDSDRHSRWHRSGRAGGVSERSRRQGAAVHGPDQDGPLDFSVKRRGSVSESFTDESRASSSVSPTSFPGATPASCSSPRVSPPSDGIFALQHHHQRQQQQQHFPATSQHQGAAARRGRLSCSEELELVGQPRTAPPGRAEGSRSTSPSAASAGHALSNGAHGKSAAALLSQNGALASPLNSLSGAFMMDPRRVAGANGGKVQRPFKAYPKELLQMPLGYLGHPTLNPLLGLDPSVLSLSQEELMAIYWQQLDFVKERDKHVLTPGKTGGGSPPSSNSSSTSSSNGSSNHSHNHVNSGSGVPTPSVGANPPHGSLTKDASPQPPPPPLLAPPSLSLPSPQYTPNFALSPSNSSSKTPSPTSVFGTGSGVHQFPPPSAPPLVSSTSSGSGGSGSRKRPRSLPDSQKDDAYWERRRKNNDAAKRSRDARRAKEDEIAIRAALLEQENLKLRVEVAALKTETARLRCMLYNS